MGCSCSGSLPGQGTAIPRDPWTLKKISQPYEPNAKKPTNRNEWLLRRHATKQNNAMEAKKIPSRPDLSQKKTNSRLEYILNR